MKNGIALAPEARWTGRNDLAGSPFGDKETVLMPRYHLDTVSRIDDVEGLLLTAQGIVNRLSAAELDCAKQSLQKTLQELRAAKTILIERWRDEDRGVNPQTDANHTGGL